MEILRDIILRQHTGRTEEGRLVRATQDQIFLNGVLVGYVGHQAGSTICIIRPGVSGDRETMAEISARITEKFGWTPAGSTAVPQLTDDEFLDSQEIVARRRDIPDEADDEE
jgi:hypothetical protein